MRRPSFQFYPADWRKDPGLRACSPSARAIWIDMLCLAHECEPYGTLCIKERAMTTQQLASAIGTTGKVMQQAIAELEANGVFSRDACGCIYSRRMVRDERLRLSRAEHGPKGAEHGVKGADHGSKGGRPRITPLKTPHVPGFIGGLETPPPSSSSSSSSSKRNEGQKLYASPDGSADTKGTRLPAEWELPKAWGEWALNEKPQWDAARVRDAAATFKDHWLGKAGKDARHADWLATWRNWIRNPLSEKTKGAFGDERQKERQRVIDELTGGSSQGRTFDQETDH